jgi:hypothetical protein
VKFNFERVIYVVKFLPFEPPSRKDTAWVWIKKSFPYCLPGFVALLLVSFFVPSLKNLPTIWFSNIASLHDWFQVSIHCILTAVWLWAVSYSVGVLLIEASRRNYRDHIVRRVERLLKVQS